MGKREGSGVRETEAGRVSLGVGVDVMGMCVSKREREREDGGRVGEGAAADTRSSRLSIHTSSSSSSLS